MKNYLLLPLLVFAFIILYVLRFEAARPRYEDGQRIRVIGVIGEEPQVYSDRQRVKLASLAFYLPRFPEYHYGDRIEVIGKVEKGEKGYSLRDVGVREIREIGEIGGGSFLLKIRENFLQSFGKFLPTREGALLKGLILGTKNSLDSDFYNDLKKTGTLHVVVASGTNVSLFAGSLIFLLSPYMGRRPTLLVGLLVVWIYVFLIGAQPPIVRAAFFASVGFVGQIFGREVGAIRLIGTIGGVMLLINPLWLFDLGFQLSFAATLGILLLGKKILGRLGRLEKLGVPKIMIGDLATTLSAQVFVTPFLFFNFGQISFISPLVNMLILWTIPPLMAGGTVLGLLGLLGGLGERIAQVGAWIIYPLLWYFVTIVTLFAKF